MTNLIPILVGLFLLAALLRIDTYFSLVYLLAVAYLLGRAWSRQSARQLRTERRLVSRAFPGENIAVELRVRNDGWLPVPWVEMHDSLPVDMITPPYFRRVLSLLPHQERRFSYDLTAQKRGYYAIGPMVWHTGDLLGFSPQQVSEHKPETIIVYPRVVPLQRLGLPTHSPLASLPAPAPLFDDPTRVIGVRDYQTGDSPRRIHWTASAGAGKLLVKRYQPAIARDTLICLDMDQGSYAFQRLYVASELAVIIAASLASHIVLRENLAVGLSVIAHDPLQEKVTKLSVPARRGRDSLMGILELLARAQTYPHGSTPEQVPPDCGAPDCGALSLADFLRQESVGLPWGSTIIVITGSEIDAVYTTLLFLRQQGFATALVLVMPAQALGGLQAPLHLPASEPLLPASEPLLPVYQVWREDDLETL
ncbi:MAG: DUF58 domain-containing protein [Anaerolineae bacterium]|nr:DUF58 domain-containing protein [Anaerolineae bacterium]